MAYVDKRVVKYLSAANLCSGRWHESFGMIISVAVGFIFMMNILLLSSLEMLLSRKLILFSNSPSIVKCIVGVDLLNVFSIYFIFVALFW